MERSEPTTILMDCDPGVDDTIALALAHASPALRIEAVTTTYGNVGIDHTTADGAQTRRTRASCIWA